MLACRGSESHPRVIGARQHFVHGSVLAPFLQGARSMRARVLARWLLWCAATVGCEAHLVDGPTWEGEGGAGGAATIVDTCASFYEEFQPAAGISFETDLVPILQKNCNAGICHGGEPESAQADLWLGPGAEHQPSEEELWFVYHSLVDIQSTVAPQLALVRSGNAAESYFMRKLDDCHEPKGLECTLDPDLHGSPCGDAMPVLTAGLSEQERSLFRSWIENGAPDN